MTPIRRVRRSALTLTELIIVLGILAALAGVVLPVFKDTRVDAANTATAASLVEIREAWRRQWADTKYLALGDVSGSPGATESQRFQMRWLFDSPVTGTTTSDFDPDSRLGWNGPYLGSITGRYNVDPENNFTAEYGTDGDPAILDSHTRSPIVIQSVGSTSPFDVRVVSAGPNGVLEIDPAAVTASLVPEGGTEPVGDDTYVSLVLR